MGCSVNGYLLEDMLATAKSLPSGYKIPVEILVEALQVAIALEENQTLIFKPSEAEYMEQGKELTVADLAKDYGLNDVTKVTELTATCLTEWAENHPEKYKITPDGCFVRRKEELKGQRMQVYVLIDAIDGGPIGVFTSFEKARQQGDKEGCVFMVLPMEVE